MPPLWDARVHGHATTAMHDMSTMSTPPSPPKHPPARPRVQALFAVAAEAKGASSKDPEILPPQASPEERSNQNGDESNPGSGAAQQQTQKEAGEQPATTAVQCRASTRFRSESCADELLAAGRGASGEALGCDREGCSAVARACEHATASVPRSKSFDWGAERAGRRASFAEDFSARKVGRG